HIRSRTMSCKSILGQAIVIVLAGAVIGLADPRPRDIKLDRSTPPPPPAGGNQNNSNPAPPIPPADTAFHPTQENDLPNGHITLPRAKSLYASGSALIAARNKEKYAAGHIKGAFRISEEDFRAGDPAILAAIPRSSTLVVYCSGGKCDESEVVARFLDGS